MEEGGAEVALVDGDSVAWAGWAETIAVVFDRRQGLFSVK